MVEGDSAPQPIPIAGLLTRPLQSLQFLPLRYRWEVTRRHPYYLAHWNIVHRLHAGLLSSPQERVLGEAAHTVLLAIGLSGDPPPPSSDVEALGLHQLGNAWQGGAVSSLSLRAMAMALVMLPPHVRGTVGRLLQESAASSEGSLQSASDEAERRFRYASALRDLQSPELDGSPSRPIVGLNIEVPKQAVLDAVEQILTEWRTRENVQERRRRPEMYDDYLRVWDLREGWFGDGYDVDREQTFQAIANRLSCPLATVANHYRSAFKMISGHEHSFENWWLLFAHLKLTGDLANKALRRRKPLSRSGKRQPSVRQVPESFMHAASPERAGPVQQQVTGATFAPEVFDFMTDVRTLLKKNWDDDAIVEEMKPADADALKAYLKHLRGHLSDAAD